jgi:phosphoribosylamine--glycine ligase
VSGTSDRVTPVYPGNYEKGKSIAGLNDSSDDLLFHAGTILKNGEVVTNGGRVLVSTGMDNDIQKALDKSYAALSGIQWDGMNYRKDIGQDLLRLKS